jgi:hypothetical protein
MKSYPYLTHVLEHEAVKSYLNESEEVLVDASARFYHLPSIIEDYVIKNLGEFIGSTLEETYANIVNFAAETTFVFLDQATTDIAENQYAVL